MVTNEMMKEKKITEKQTKKLNKIIKRLELKKVSIESRLTILKSHLRKLQDAENRN